MSKNLKRILTVIMSLAMVLSLTIPAFAAPLEIDDLADPEEYGDVSGEGEVIFFDVDDVVKIIIPTDAALNFTLDPMGLSALTDGGEGMTLEQLRSGPAAGSVNFNKFTPVVINESTFKVLVDFDVKITGDVVAVDELAKVNPVGPPRSEDANLFIGMSVSKNSVTNLSANEDTFVGSKQLDLDKTGKTVEFRLDEAEYLVRLVGGKYVYEKNPAKEGFGTQLLFEGLCNPYGDWADFAGVGLPASEAVVTYAGLVTAIGAMVENDTIAVGTAGPFTMKDTVVDDTTEFNSLAELLDLLNDAFEDEWVFSVDGVNIIATAEDAGEVGESGPDAVPGSASITDGDEDPVIAGVLTEGREEDEDYEEATKTVGIEAIFSFDEAVGDEILILTADAYGLIAPAATEWTDVERGPTTPEAIRNGTAAEVTISRATWNATVGFDVILKDVPAGTNLAVIEADTGTIYGVSDWAGGGVIDTTGDVPITIKRISGTATAMVITIKNNSGSTVYTINVTITA